MRRAEVHMHPELKHTRWLWLKNFVNLNARQRDQLEKLRARNSKTAQAYQMRFTLQEIFAIQDGKRATIVLKNWIENAKTSKLSPMVKVAYTFENHWKGMIRWFESNISNGVLEGFNSLL